MEGKSMIGSVSDLGTSPLAQLDRSDRSDPKALKLAAGEFESLLLTELLKSMREASSEGWLGGGEDQAGSTMVEMAEQQLAQALAASGGLGLSNLVVQGLAPETHRVPGSPAGVAITAR
jgi:flagellar protein FlgJ